MNFRHIQHTPHTVRTLYTILINAILILIINAQYVRATNTTVIPSIITTAAYINTTTSVPYFTMTDDLDNEYIPSGYYIGPKCNIINKCNYDEVSYFMGYTKFIGLAMLNPYPVFRKVMKTKPHSVTNFKFYKSNVELFTNELTNNTVIIRNLKNELSLHNLEDFQINNIVGSKYISIRTNGVWSIDLLSTQYYMLLPSDKLFHYNDANNVVNNKNLRVIASVTIKRKIDRKSTMYTIQCTNYNNGQCMAYYEREIYLDNVVRVMQCIDDTYNVKCIQKRETRHVDIINNFALAYLIIMLIISSLQAIAFIRIFITTRKQCCGNCQPNDCKCSTSNKITKAIYNGNVACFGSDLILFLIPVIFATALGKYALIMYAFSWLYRICLIITAAIMFGLYVCLAETILFCTDICVAIDLYISGDENSNENENGNEDENGNENVNRNVHERRYPLEMYIISVPESAWLPPCYSLEPYVPPPAYKAERDVYTHVSTA